jgi:hypothetical protein
MARLRLTNTLTFLCDRHYRSSEKRRELRAWFEDGLSSVILLADRLPRRQKEDDFSPGTMDAGASLYGLAPGRGITLLIALLVYRG